MNDTLKKKLQIEYSEAPYTALDAQDSELIKKAIEACKNSYAPYSHYHVGAALRLGNGMILTGSNQENAAFPVCMCAERSVLFYAHANYPNERVVALAIATIPEEKENETNKDAAYPELSTNPASPCGSCRQALLQSEVRGGAPIRLLTAGANIVRIFDSISDLIPFGFVAIV